MEQEDELVGEQFHLILNNYYYYYKKLRVAHKSTETIKGRLLVLEIILGRLGAMKKGR